MLVAKPLCWFCRDAAHLFFEDKNLTLHASWVFKHLFILGKQEPKAECLEIRQQFSKKQNKKQIKNNLEILSLKLHAFQIMPRKSNF
jgi:hypothetical protein